MREAISGVRAGLKMIGVVVAGLSVSACVGAGSDPGDSLGNLFAFNTTSPPPAPAAVSEARVVCPYLDVLEGGAAHRVYAGAQESRNVRYQFSLGDVARQCRVENGQLLLKIGVEGKVLLGPAGAPSSFNVPVTIAVRNEKNEQIVAERTYQVAASIPSGAAHTTFNVVSEDIAVPFTGERADASYQIFVGLDGANSASNRARARRR